MPRKEDQELTKWARKPAKGMERSPAEKAQQSSGRKKDKVLPNPWAYKVTLPSLHECNKCDMTDLIMLSCRSNFMIKPLPVNYTEESRDEDLYRIFGGLLNQGVSFIKQWIQCFIFTRKGYVNNLAKTYLKSKGLKLGIWLKSIKEGK